jgi:hypothetical protein
VPATGKGAPREVLRTMIIKQKETFMDPLLLKVIYPYAYPKYRRALSRISKYWNEEVVELHQQEEDLRVQWLAEEETGEGLGYRLSDWWHRISDTVTRWLEPRLEPVPVAVRSNDNDHRGTQRRKK